MQIDFSKYKNFESVKDGLLFKKKVNIDNKTRQPVIHGFFGRIVRFLSVSKSKREELNKASREMFIGAIRESFDTAIGLDIEKDLLHSNKQTKTLSLRLVQDVIRLAEKSERKLEDIKAERKAKEVQFRPKLTVKSPSNRKSSSLEDVRFTEYSLLGTAEHSDNLIDPHSSFLPKSRSFIISKSQSKYSFSQPASRSGSPDDTDSNSGITRFSVETDDFDDRLNSAKNNKNSKISPDIDNLAKARISRPPTFDRLLHGKIINLKKQSFEVLDEEEFDYVNIPESQSNKTPDDHILQPSAIQVTDTAGENQDISPAVEHAVADPYSLQVAEFCDKILGASTFQNIVNSFKNEPATKHLMDVHGILDAEAVSIRFCALMQQGNIDLYSTISQQRFNQAMDDSDKKDKEIYPMIECALRGLKKLPGDNRNPRFEIIRDVATKKDYSENWKQMAPNANSFISLPNTTVEQAENSPDLIYKYEMKNGRSIDVSNFCATEGEKADKMYMLIPNADVTPFSSHHNSNGGLIITYHVTDSRGQ